MKTLIHYKKQQLETFTTDLIQLNQLYVQRSFSFDAILSNFLSNATQFFEQISESTNSSKVSQLTIYLETAKKGINPQTLERLKTGKRENIWIASYHVLDEITTLMQNALIDIELIISKAQELVEQVLLSAMQSHLIDDHSLQILENHKQVSNLWNQLTQNEQVKLIERKLKLSITQDDIIILCDQVCSKMRS